MSLNVSACASQKTCKSCASKKDARLALIDQLDMEPAKFKLVLEHKWTVDRCDSVEKAYKGFLKLILLFPDDVAVPTLDVDEMWHTHILDTRKYMADCFSVFGEYLHHYPYLGQKDAADAEYQSKTFEQTRTRYREVLGFDVFGQKAADCGGGCGGGGCSSCSSCGGAISSCSSGSPSRKDKKKKEEPKKECPLKKEEEKKKKEEENRKKNNPRRRIRRLDGTQAEVIHQEAWGAGAGGGCSSDPSGARKGGVIRRGSCSGSVPRRECPIEKEQIKKKQEEENRKKNNPRRRIHRLDGETARWVDSITPAEGGLDQYRPGRAEVEKLAKGETRH